MKTQTEMKAEKAEYDRRRRHEKREAIRQKKLEYCEDHRGQETARAKQWYKENRERALANAAAYRAANKERIKAEQAAIRHANKGRKYGLTKEQYDEMLAACKGRCPCCKVPFSGLWESVASVDHCHRTNVVRGIICRRCNLVMGHADDNTTILRACLRYLEAAKDVSC